MWCYIINILEKNCQVQYLSHTQSGYVGLCCLCDRIKRKQTLLVKRMLFPLD